MQNCYCGSDKIYENCCKPFHNGMMKPPTAEALMRSRYSTYVIVNVDYILKTTHPKTRKLLDSKSIKDWAESNSWQKLEIISAVDGSQNESKGTVEFKAYYLDSSSQPQIHHEISNFARELGKWFFVDGTII